MRVPKGLTLWISLLPLVVIVLITIIGGVVFYQMASSYFIDDLYGGRLSGLLSEKKAVLDAWFELRKNEAETVAKGSLIREHAAKLAQGVGIPAVTSWLQERASTERGSTLVLISPAGKVVAGSDKAFINEDWTSRDFFKTLAPQLKATIVAGISRFGEASHRVVILSPVLDSSGKVLAIVCLLSDVKGLSLILRIEKGPYRTEEIDMIDREGITLLTNRGVPLKKEKYAISFPAVQQPLNKQSGVLFSVADLNQAPFRLIGSAEMSEVTGPLNSLLTLYFLIAGCIILFVAVQSFLIVPRLVTGPLRNLTNSVHSVARGTPDERFGKAYPDEVSDLRDAIALLSEGSKGRELFLREEMDEIKKKQSTLQPIREITGRIAPETAVQQKGYDEFGAFEMLTRQFEETLIRIRRSIANVMDKRKDLPDAERSSMEVIDGFLKGSVRMLSTSLDIVHLERGSRTLSPMACNCCSILQEVKEYGEILRGLRYIELLVECDERLTDQYIHVDSDRLRELLICLMSFTICSLDTGAVTLVASRIGTEGIEHVEFLIGHHGYYSEGALLGSGNESNNYTVGPLEITLAQKLAVALGGSVTVEREGRNLPVFVVSIPAVV